MKKKKNWNVVCAGLIAISLLASCAGRTTAGGHDAGQGASPAGSTAAVQDPVEGEEDPVTAVPAGPAETLEEVFKNHDAHTDTLSRWNAKAKKKERDSWVSCLTPAQEQAVIDSMNENFKKAVLEKAYEGLEAAEEWDEADLSMKALLDHGLYPKEKMDAYLLARSLYAENLEHELWAGIRDAIDKERERHPEYFPEPSGNYYADGRKSNVFSGMTAVYEEAESETADSYMDVPASDTEDGAEAYPGGMDDGGQDQYGGMPFNTAEYNTITENPFKSVAASPLSTFSIDVDTAGYTKLKYDILDGYGIEKDEVKIEELINYFNFDYSGSRAGDEPFTVSTEYTQCPWNSSHGLIRIGIQADDRQEKPDTNFVLVTDVSGSMMLINKLPLALSAYADMLEGFDEKDTISMMYYASGQGVILENVSCDKKEEIYKGLAEALTRAGGGTYGSLGLQTAYEMAEKSYIENGVNRILIATDGDFNIGVTSEGALKEIVEAGRQKGVYLTILGYGSENLKDNKMEVMAENGNGNYHYIGDMTDARKALVQESASTLIPMADDVKIQVEFNPSLVQEYRLIGYESRILNAEDFNNDKVDAGDVGAGKSVTALYEVVPAGEENVTDTPDLKYSKTEAAGDTDDLCTVSIRYKDINSGKTGSESRLVEKPVLAADYHEIPDANTALAISLAEAGMTIRDSEYKGTATLTSAEAIAKAVAAETGNDLALSWADLLRTLISQSE